MAQYQYITNSGKPAYFDALDDSAAGAAFAALGDRDPHSGYGLVTGAPPPTAPATAPARDYSKLARTAGASGLNPSEYSSLLGPTPEEEKAAKDAIAKQFGYGSADEFFTDAFRKPSKTTEQFYRSAYDAAGLPRYIRDITRKRNDLAKAVGVIGDNPWLDESSRSGKTRRLQELANADIQTLENEYQLRLGHVHDLVSQHAIDLGEDEKIRDARLQYLENAVKEASTAAGKNRALDNLSEYLDGRQSTEKEEAPKTVSAPGTSNLYQYDPVTGGWKVIQKGRAPAAKAAKQPALTPEQKLVAAFTKSLTSRTALNRAGNREQFIRELQAQYPQIEPGDIPQKVYETYPDGYNQ